MFNKMIRLYIHIYFFAMIGAVHSLNLKFSNLRDNFNIDELKHIDKLKFFLAMFKLLFHIKQ